MKQKLDFILEYIASADMEDMSRIIETVIRKCDALTTETEAVLLFLPRGDREEQEKYLREIYRFLEGNPDSAMDKR